MSTKRPQVYLSFTDVEGSRSLYCPSKENSKEHLSQPDNLFSDFTVDVGLADETGDGIELELKHWSKANFFVDRPDEHLWLSASVYLNWDQVAVLRDYLTFLLAAKDA